MYRHILVPTDGSPLSVKAVENSLAFAKAVNARVTLLTVTEPFHIFSADANQLSASREDYRRHAKEMAGRYLADAQARAKAMGVACAALHVEHEHPYQAIIDAAAQQGCDLIAMASHGRRGMAAIVLGSETAKVLTHSAIPVLVYR